MPKRSCKGLSASRAKRPRPVGFTAERRAELLATRQPLPRAMRYPPHLSTSGFVLSRLANSDGTLNARARRWLEDERNRAALDALRREFVAKYAAMWPLKANTFARLVRELLLGLLSDSPNRETTWCYSVPVSLSKLQAIKLASGADGLYAHDHYSEDAPGPWFVLDLLYRLVRKLEHTGDLDPLPRAESDCPICLKNVTDAGELWHHLEPCRHWLCDACSRQYLIERGERECPQCRGAIVYFARARSYA